MQATRIIAVRHGETDWNVATRIQGQLDIPLNALGQWQAAQVAQALQTESLDAVYASDLARAWATGESIAQAAGRPLQAHTGLRERGFGSLQGQTFAEIEAAFPEDARRWRSRDPHWAPPGGESLIGLGERMAHGGVLDVLYRLATGQEIQAPRTWNLGNATINRLLWTPETLTLVGWADARHLDEAAVLDEGAD